MKCKSVKKIIWLFGVLMISIVLGVVLMFLVYALPVENMRQNVRETLQIQLDEGDYYTWISGDDTSRSDNFTDAWMIQNAIYNGNESTLDKALLNPSAGYAEGTETQSLEKVLKDIPEDYHIEYGRYWHGYLIVLKPLLLILNYSEIRWVKSMVACFLMTIIFFLLYKRFRNYKYSIAFFASVLFLNPIVMRASLQFNTVFFVILLEYIAMLFKGDQLKKQEKTEVLFLISGILVAFVDLLTYPISALGMLLILQDIMFDEPLKKRVKQAFAGLVCWCLGYSGMWAAKWGVASVFTGKNMIKNAVEQVAYRSGTDIGIDGWEFSYKGLFKGNFNWLLNSSNALLFKMFLGILIFTIIVFFIKKEITIKVNIPLAIMQILFCFIPIARYLVLKNHSYIHSFFTYREGMVYVMASLCLVFGCIQKIPKQDIVNEKTII